MSEREQRTIELLGKYGDAKFGDEWWPGNARAWLGADGRVLEYLLDPGSAKLADDQDPEGPYDGPPDLPPDDTLPDDVLVYLSRLVAGDIRKRTKSIDRFAPKDGQDPAEAAEALARFRSAREWRRMVLARLADLTQDPVLWRANAVEELPDDYDPDDEGGEWSRHRQAAVLRQAATVLRGYVFQRDLAEQVDAVAASIES